MRKVALIYNPVSGLMRARQMARIEAIAPALRDAGVEVVMVETQAPGTAGAQAQNAIAEGCDTVLACGGDGTVNEVLQGVVGTDAALGVIPMGTANALAADLGLPAGSERLVRVLFNAQPVRVAAGHITYKRGPKTLSRYFTVAVGIGPDAHLMYKLNAQRKRRWGYPFYILEAFRTWFTHDYPLFSATLHQPQTDQRRLEEVSQLLAVRITDFGHMVRRVAPGAALRRNDLRLVLFKTRSRIRYLRYLTAVFFGFEPNVRNIDLADAISVQCDALQGTPARIYVEADGEFLGTLPAKIGIVPDAVTLLMPEKA